MKKISKKEALEKVLHLFDSAEDVAGANIVMANRFISKAKQISMKVKLRLPPVLKRKFCKHCGNYFIPGKNYRVRMKNKKVIYSCLNCRHFMRFPTAKTNS